MTNRLAQHMPIKSCLDSIPLSVWMTFTLNAKSAQEVVDQLDGRLVIALGVNPRYPQPVQSSIAVNC
jgi:hypothetical protein